MDPANPLAASTEPQHQGTQSTIENTPRHSIDFGIQENYQAPEASQTQSPTQENTAPREFGPVVGDEPELPTISNSTTKSNATSGKTEIPDSEEAMDYSPVTSSQMARLDALHAPQSSPTNAGVGADVPEIVVGEEEDGDLAIESIDDQDASTGPVVLVSSVGGVAIPSEASTRGQGGEATTIPDIATRSSQSGMESLDVTAEKAMKALMGSTVVPGHAEADVEPAIRGSGGTGGNAPRRSRPLPTSRTEVPDSDDESCEDSQIEGQVGVGQLSGGGVADPGLDRTESGLNTANDEQRDSMVDNPLIQTVNGPPEQSNIADEYDSTQDETQPQSVEKTQEPDVAATGDESTQDLTQSQPVRHPQDREATSNADESTQSGSEEWSHAQKVVEYESTQDRSEPQSLNSWPTISEPQSAQPRQPESIDDGTPGSTRGPTPMEVDEPVTLQSQPFNTQNTQILNTQEMNERISVNDPSQGPTESNLYPEPHYSGLRDTDGQFEKLPATQAISNSSNPSHSNLPPTQPMQPPSLPDPQPMLSSLQLPAPSLKRSAPIDVDEQGEDMAEAEHPPKSAIESSKMPNTESIQSNEHLSPTDDELPDAPPSSNSIQNLSTVANIPPSPSPPEDPYTAVKSRAKEVHSSHPLSSPSKSVAPSSSSSKQSQAAEGSQSKDILMAELKAMKISSLQARNSALEAEIASRRAKLEAVTKDLTAPASQTVKKHIKLLHDYNDIRDVGQGLIGMIADNRGVRIGSLYEEFGVDVKD